MWFHIHGSPGRCLDNPTIFSNSASTLIFYLLCSEPANILPTPTHQSKPTNLEKAVVRNWCETMQASGVSSRFCHASFTVRASAHLRCAESKKKRGACSTKLRHIFIDNHTTATACLAMECQMTQRSHLERNHRNPADSALSAAASSVGSTARSIVHFAR